MILSLARGFPTLRLCKEKETVSSTLWGQVCFVPPVHLNFMAQAAPGTNKYLGPEIFLNSRRYRSQARVIIAQRLNRTYGLLLRPGLSADGRKAQERRGLLHHQGNLPRIWPVLGSQPGLCACPGQARRCGARVQAAHRHRRHVRCDYRHHRPDNFENFDQIS